MLRFLSELSDLTDWQVSRNDNSRTGNPTVSNRSLYEHIHAGKTMWTSKASYIQKVLPTHSPCEVESYFKPAIEERWQNVASFGCGVEVRQEIICLLAPK